MGRVQRRQFLVAGSALLAAQLARAQTDERDRVRTIGYLSLDALDPKAPSRGYPSTKALAKLGWIEGQNIVIERRFAAHKRERLPELVQELIRKRVELIVVVGGAAALAAARVTRTIPIVFINVAFPIEQGLVDSFAQPGRNITGATVWVPRLAVKRFEFLRDVAPAAKRVYSIHVSEFHEDIDGKRLDLAASVMTNIRRLGIEAQEHFVEDQKDVEAALAQALSWGAQAISVAASPLTESLRHRGAEFALRHQLPSAFGSAVFVDAGGLLSYGLSLKEWQGTIERGMAHVDRILRGANPAGLPVDQPLNYELVINLKTAKALGLSIPQSILLGAGRVIE